MASWLCLLWTAWVSGRAPHVYTVLVIPKVPFIPFIPLYCLRSLSSFDIFPWSYTELSYYSFVSGLQCQLHFSGGAYLAHLLHSIGSWYLGMFCYHYRRLDEAFWGITTLLYGKVVSLNLFTSTSICVPWFTSSHKTFYCISLLYEYLLLLILWLEGHLSQSHPGPLIYKHKITDGFTLIFCLQKEKIKKQQK